MDEINAQMILSNNRVLVIEDEPGMQGILAELLRDAGYDPVQAATAEEGLRLAEESLPGIILLDLRLPKNDGENPSKDAGLMVCQELSKKESTRGISIIVVTCFHELGTKLSSFMAGAKRYVTKPFDINNLPKEIEAAFRQRGLGQGDAQSPLVPRD